MKKIFSLVALALLVSATLVSCSSGSSSKKQLWHGTDDLQNKRIGIMVGSIYEEYVAEHLPNATRVYFDNIPDLLVALKTEKCDAIVTNGDAYLAFSKLQPDVGVLVGNLMVEGLGVGFNNKSTQLRQSFNEFLHELKESGELKKINDKWMYHFDTAAAPTIGGDGSGGTIRFGTSGVNTPSSFTKDGHLAGYDVEIMFRYATKHNLKVDVQRIPFGGLVAAVASGKVDAVADGIGITKERVKQILLSDPYKEKDMCFVALKKNIAAYNKDKDSDKKQFRSLDDIKDKRLGIWVGSIYDAYAKEHFPKAKLIYIDESPDLALSLINEKSDAFMMNSDASAYFMHQYPQIGVLHEIPDADTLGFGFNYNNTKLRDSFNKFLQELGPKEVKAICDSWMNNFETLPVPTLGGNGSDGTLRLGTSGTTVPCSSVKDGKPAGYDIDLVYRYAATHNLKVEISFMPFGSLIAALASNKVDMIANGIVINNERKKQVAFSTPYRTRAFDFLVLKKNIATDNQDGDGANAKASSKFQPKSIGVMVGTAHESIAKKIYPDLPFMRGDATPDMLIALKSGKVDAFVIDDVALGILLPQEPTLGVLTDNLAQFDNAFGFNFNNPKLRESFNKFLEEEKASGLLPAIVEKWKNHGDDAEPPVNTGDGSGGTIRLGTTGVDIPYSFVKQGKPAGVDIEVLYRYASMHNIKVEIHRYAFGGLIAALISGKVDVIASGISITSERAKQVAFSEPYMQTNVAMLALKTNIAENNAEENAKKFQGLNDVRNKRIGVLIGSLHDIFATKNLPEASLFRGEDMPDLVAALASHKVDAILMTDVAAKFYLEKYTDIGILEKNITTDSLGIAFNLKNTQLQQSFNEFLHELQASGEVAKIYDKWENHLDETPAPVVTGDGSGGTLRVGTSSVSIPFTFVKDGKPAGVEIEMVYRFASKHNMKVEVQKMLFSGLIPSLLTGKVDMLASSISMTAERKKQIAFSDSHLQIPIHAAALKSNIAAYDNSEDVQPKGKGFFASVAESFHSNLVVEHRYLLIVNGLTTTLLITIFAVLLGTLLGGLICYLRMHKNKVWRGVGQTYVSIVAGTPVLVFLMIMFYIVFAKVPISPVLVAIIALALAFGAYVSQIYQTSIQAINKGQTEAGIAMGFTKVGTFIHIILPQAIRIALPLYRGEVISMLKTTAIVGYIAVEDLTKAGDIIRSRTFDAFFPLLVVAIIYFAIARLLAFVLEKISQRSDPKYKQAKALRNR